MPRSSVAIAALRPRLSKVLLDQVKRELPAVIDDIDHRLAECRTELRKLGQRRGTLDEQRRFLFNLAQRYQNIAKAAIDGVYGDAFFGDPRTDSGYSKRIRAVVQNLSLDYAEDMRRNGHRYHIITDEIATEDTIEDTDLTIEKPTRMSRGAYLEHAKKLLVRSRGRELPGTFNPLVIADLFHEQSVFWPALSHNYVDAVWAATRSFVESVLLHLTQEETASKLMQEIMDPIMEDKISQISNGVNSIIDQYRQGHSITYNHYFTETIQNVRAKRMEAELEQRLRKHLGGHSEQNLEDLSLSRVRLSSLISALSIRNEADMDLYACSEAADCMFAYYKVAMKTVVDNVVIQCIENMLIKILPEIISPTTVLDIDANKISKVAEESSFSTDQREQLLARERILGAGLDTCRSHVTARGFAKASNSHIQTKCLFHGNERSNGSTRKTSESDDPQAYDSLANALVDHSPAIVAEESHKGNLQRTQPSLDELNLAFDHQEVSADDHISWKPRLEKAKKKDKKRNFSWGLD